MGFADRAAEAAHAERARRIREEAEAGPSSDPQDKRYVPSGGSWDRFEAAVALGLEEIAGEDPGPAQRLEPRSYAMRAQAHSYPDELRRSRLCVFRPDGLEIVAWEGPRGIRYGLVRRSSNPNEEAMVSPFRTAAELGEAVG